MNNHLLLLSEVEERIQKTVNDILKNNKSDQFGKLPGLIESLKILKEMSNH